MLDVQEVRLRFIFVRALYPVPLFSKALGNAPSISKRTWMSVVLRSSDVFATQKLASRSVHGCTLLDSLFQKPYGKYVLRYAATENAQRIRADRDVRGSAQ